MHRGLLLQVYGLPFGMTKHFQARIGDPLRARLKRTGGPMLPKWRAAKRSVARAVTCCGFIGPVHDEKELTVCFAGNARPLATASCNLMQPCSRARLGRRRTRGHWPGQGSSLD